MKHPPIDWPDGKAFAFTIIDDTDRATLENTRQIYDLLHSLGVRTTKTVWPLQPPTGSEVTGGATLADPEYRAWALDLVDRGFEVAFHGATDASSAREDIIRGLDRFRSVFGQDPSVHVNHVGQAESMYWGIDRVGGWRRLAYATMSALRRQPRVFCGHVEGSANFWGDLCRERVTYVRNLSFPEINTLSIDPMMPFHDPRKPYVKYWFSCSEGSTHDAFCRLISPSNQDRLLREGGACIAYTHFGFGFTEEGRPRQEFSELIERLARLPGWFVPASELLDFLRSRPTWKHEADKPTLSRMERRWLLARIRHGPT